MSIKPVNTTYKEQNSRLIRSTFKKGFIVAVNLNSFTVDVSYADSPQTVIKNVPVADVVDITTLSNGQRCRVDVFDETNPSGDCVMCYTY